MPTLPETLTRSLGLGQPVPDEALASYAVDGLVPTLAVQPTTREAIGEVLAWASAAGRTVTPWGGGTQMALGNVPTGMDVALDLTRLNRLLDHQPADLTATVEAGMPLAEFQRELAAEGKIVALEAPLAGKATVGGILAANASGPLRHSYGLARDWLIGISVVGPEGTQSKAGGRVVKNVTGYDLNKMYCGSLGTLGIFVEATFKLAPAAAEFGALAGVLGSVGEAVECARGLLREVYSPQGVQVVDGAAAARLGLGEFIKEDRAAVIGFVAGRARAVRRRLEESARLLAGAGAEGVEELNEGEAVGLRERITDLGWGVGAIPTLGVTLNIPPAATGNAVGWPGEAGITRSAATLADPGFGRVDLLWWGAEDWESGEMVEAVERLRKLAVDSGGSAVVRQGPVGLKREIDVWGTGGGEVELMRRLKQVFDPVGVLNPGRGMGRL